MSGAPPPPNKRITDKLEEYPSPFRSSYAVCLAIDESMSKMLASVAFLAIPVQSLRMLVSHTDGSLSEYAN